MTAEKKKLYPLTPLDEVRVEMLIDRFGETYELVHVFREPTAADKREYARAQVKVIGQGRKQKFQPNSQEALENLWNGCIKRVEGYETPPEGQDWKALIDLDHKLIAIEELLKKCGTVVEADTEKNL